MGISKRKFVLAWAIALGVPGVGGVAVIVRSEAKQLDKMANKQAVMRRKKYLRFQEIMILSGLCEGECKNLNTIVHQ